MTSKKPKTSETCFDITGESIQLTRICETNLETESEFLELVENAKKEWDLKNNCFVTSPKNPRNKKETDLRRLLAALLAE